MTLRFRQRCVAVAFVLSVTATFGSPDLWAENPAQWAISEATTGQDVLWTSPTAVDLGFPRYATSFEFTRIEVFFLLGSSDITDQFDSSGIGVSETLPVTLIDDNFSEPTTNSSATINTGIDASGFGQIAISDVQLGFPIIRVEVDANLTVRGLVPGDFDENLIVDSQDLALWESAYGVNNAADTNFDGESDGLDLLEWQRYVGSDFTALGSATAPVPEPAPWLLMLMGLTCPYRWKPSS